MDNKVDDNRELRKILRMFTQISAWIAIPVILALYTGKYFDAKYNTEPWAFISFTGLAFLVSTIGIWKVLKKYMKETEQEEINKKNRNGTSSQ